MVDDIDENLHLTLRLHISPHDAKTEPGPAVFGDHGRDDRVKGPFVRLELIGMPFLEREKRTTVLQHETEVSRDVT